MTARQQSDMGSTPGECLDNRASNASRGTCHHNDFGRMSFSHDLFPLHDFYVADFSKIHSEHAAQYIQLLIYRV
jgi:hypothetical protein